MLLSLDEGTSLLNSTIVDTDVLTTCESHQQSENSAHGIKF